MSKECIALKQYREALIDKARKEGIEQGIEQGRKQGAFELALKIKKTYGLKQAVLISGFSPEELECEELNR